MGLKSGWRLTIEGGGEISLEAVLQHALEEEVDRGKLGAVRRFSDSSTPSEQAGKPALAIDDSRARVARPGEGTGLGVARQDGDLLRHLIGLALEVDPGERTDGVEASDGEVGGVAALDDHDAWVVIVAEGLRARLPHLLVRDRAIELEGDGFSGTRTEAA